MAASPASPDKAAHGCTEPGAAEREIAGQGRQQHRVRGQENTNFFEVERPVIQLGADQVLKSQHRILLQVYEELLEILKKFEGSSNPIDRLAGVRIAVVGDSVDGARGGVPIHPQVVQNIRNEVIEEVVEPRGVGCLRVVSYTELLQDCVELRVIHQILERNP